MLEEETSKHMVQVLRMNEGERLLLTDGKGGSAECEITSAHKKHCTVRIISFSHKEKQGPKLTAAISLIKNTSRFEWFLEKATELGVFEIIPLICERTEKQHFRYDRFAGICKSAMLQSMQYWLPVLHEPVKFSSVVENAQQQQKFIAHCVEGNKQELSSSYNSSLASHIVLIGPEGDFTDGEIARALQHDFSPVSLGNTRLRTETAGLYAAVMCR